MIGIINESMMYVLHQSKYFANCLSAFVFIPTHNQVQQNSLLERSWNGDDFSVVGLVFTKKALNVYKTEKCNR